MSLLYPMQSIAQQSPEQTQEENEMTVERIEITTKRTESIDELPQAITSLSAKALRESGAQGFSDYLPTVSGVQFNYGGSVFNQVISIRGVSDGNSALTQTPVALILDETPLTLSQGALNLDYSVFGISQVNVIKGPHSTLYGASSLGGTIKIETTKPDLFNTSLSLQADINSVSRGGTGNLLAAQFSTPITEGESAIDVTVYRRQQAGFIDEPTLGVEDLNESTTQGAKIAYRYQPNDDLTVDASLIFQKIESDGLPLYSPSTGDLVSKPLQFLPTDGDELFLASLVIKYDLGFADFVSASSFYDRESFVTQDFTLSFFTLGIPGAIVDSNVDATADVFNQELRLVSNSDGAFKWLAGLYYATESYQELAEFNNSVVGGLFNGPLQYDYVTKAAFAEVSYDITEALTLTAGGRVTQYDVDADFLLTGAFVTPGLYPFVRSENESDFSPRIALNYQLDNGSIYAQASRGFRVGQPNVPIVSLPGENVPEFFGSDSLWNYEVGAKLEWLNRRVTTNFAYYMIDWKDIQLTQASGTGFTYVGNAGSADITGVEFDVTAILTQGLVLTLNGSLNDGELAQDVAGVGQKGDRLPSVPERQFYAALQYSFEVGNYPMMARLDYLNYGDYLDSFNNVATGEPLLNGDYERLNMRLVASLLDDQLELALYGTNLTDDRPIITRAFGAGEDFTTIQPRTFGLSFTYRPY